MIYLVHFKFAVQDGHRRHVFDMYDFGLNEMPFDYIDKVNKIDNYLRSEDCENKVINEVIDCNIPFEIVRVWNTNEKNIYNKLRKLKNWKKLCPVCSGNKIIGKGRHGKVLTVNVGIIK